MHLATDPPLAEQLVDAHRNGALIATFSSPMDVAAAMRDQRRVAEALGASVAGWKVAIHPALGAVAAPLLAHLTRTTPATWPVAERLMIEVEIAIRLGRDLPPAIYSRAAIVDAIESMSVGVELVRSRLTDGARAPFPAFLADNLGNDGYVAAAPTAGWTEIDWSARRCVITIDGASAHDAPCAHPQGDPLAPLIAYASAQNDALGGLRARQIVTMGSVCGVVAIKRPCLMVAEIETLGAVEVAFV